MYVRKWCSSGENDNGSLLSTELIYPNKTVVDGLDLPKKRYCHCATRIDDHRIVIVAGGSSDKSTTIYDTRTKTFQDGPNMFSEHCQCASAVFKSAKHGGRRVLIAGEENNFEIWDFDVASTWEAGKYFKDLE